VTSRHCYRQCNVLIARNSFSFSSHPHSHFHILFDRKTGNRSLGLPISYQGPLDKSFRRKASTVTLEKKKSQKKAGKFLINSRKIPYKPDSCFRKSFACPFSVLAEYSKNTRSRTVVISIRFNSR